MLLRFYIIVISEKDNNIPQAEKVFYSSRSKTNLARKLVESHFDDVLHPDKLALRAVKESAQRTLAPSIRWAEGTT
jgi:hypothetical protein